MIDGGIPVVLGKNGLLLGFEDTARSVPVDCLTAPARRKGQSWKGEAVRRPVFGRIRICSEDSRAIGLRRERPQVEYVLTDRIVGRVSRHEQRDQAARRRLRIRPLPLPALWRVGLERLRVVSPASVPHRFVAEQFDLDKVVQYRWRGESLKV